MRNIKSGIIPIKPRPRGGRSSALGPKIDRIIRKHHPAIQNQIARLKNRFRTAVQDKDRLSLLMVSVYKLFLQLADDLEAHIVMEEKLIFPTF